MSGRKWQDVGMEIAATLENASRGHRYQLMEVAALKFKISARRVRDIVACVSFLNEITKSHPPLHAFLAGRSVTDVARTLDAWRRQNPPRPLPTELPAVYENYVSTVLATARTARNVGLSKRREPVNEANFGDYLRATHLTWVEKDILDPRFTVSTERLHFPPRLGIGVHPPLENLIGITWQKPEGVWAYRKIHAVGYRKSSEAEPHGGVTVGVQFVKSPSITHLRERAIGLFLGAMGLTHYVSQLVLILPNEHCFKSAIEMCQKAGFQNGDQNVWWMYPLWSAPLEADGLSFLD
jgi:hypothetical protein